METNFNEESHSKGKQFENFVQNKMFPKSHYEIIHRTSDYEQNSIRFVSDTLKPDFKIKSLVTNEEFYVEVKYRSKTFNNVYDILSDTQLESFPEYAKEAPIYIAFGCGGEPSQPEYVSLIPYSIDISKSHSPEEVLYYKVEELPIAVSSLPKADVGIIGNDTETESEVQEPATKAIASQKSSKNYFIWIAIGVIGILFIGQLSGLFSKHEAEPISHQKILEDKVMAYYEFINNYQFDSLAKFYQPKVNWYGGIQSPSTIISSAKKLQKEIPYLQSLVDPKSITVIEQQDGDYYVTYDMVYKRRKRFEQKDEIYNLKIITTWNNNFRLKSVSEVRK